MGNTVNIGSYIPQHRPTIHVNGRRALHFIRQTWPIKQHVNFSGRHSTLVLLLLCCEKSSLYIHHCL